MRSPNYSNAYSNCPYDYAMPHIQSSSYGESRLRMLRVMRRGDRHDPKDLTIAVRFEGNFSAAFTGADPAGLLPGEPIKNLVHPVAPGQAHPPIPHLRPPILAPLPNHPPPTLP